MRNLLYESYIFQPATPSPTKNRNSFGDLDSDWTTSSDSESDYDLEEADSDIATAAGGRRSKSMIEHSKNFKSLS